MTRDVHPPEYPAGTLFGGRFRIESLLGQGGTAYVFQAHDLATGQTIALKVVKKIFRNREQAVDRFAREGELLRELNHPAIVRVDTWGEELDGTLFLAMELLRGESLRTRLERGPLGLDELHPIIRDVCSALSEAHRHGVVHRDLKPDNFFLVAEPREAVVKLLDFGMSKALGREKLTRTGQIVGTPRYMAPEQLSGEAGVDPRADVYSMGIVMYEALSGQLPFPGTVPSELIVAILTGQMVSFSSVCPKEAEVVAGVIERAVAREATHRHADIETLFAAWSQALASRELQERSPQRYRTAAMGEVEDPLSGGGLLDDERPSHSGTFSALPAVSASSALPVTAASERPTKAQPLEPRAAPSSEGSSASPPEEPKRALPATPVRRPVNSKDLTRRDSAPQNEDVYRPRHRGFWRTLTRAHFASFIASAVLGALAAGSWIAWQMTEPRAFWEAEPSPTMEAVDATETPDVVIDEIQPPQPVGHPDSSGGLDEPSESPEPTLRVRRRSAERRRPTGGTESPTRGVEIDDVNSQVDMGRQSAGSGGRQASGERVEAEADDPRGYLMDARNALRAGQYDVCISNATDAYVLGAVSALVVRGDCLRARGSTRSALKDYQRFCQHHGNHPSVRLARERARSLGAGCP